MASRVAPGLASELTPKQFAALLRKAADKVEREGFESIRWQHAETPLDVRGIVYLGATLREGGVMLIASGS